ncbi:UvrB/UvrC motif-containing protein [Flagellimonas lutimaris]|uniref:UvrB/UvrC motif-containing protein n=1 Tax=Flagellimonas lutimaris TaxID=475082 RepID=UPI0039C39C93
MIRIFNKKLDAEILIDENVEWIQFNPRDYEDKPYVTIEMKGFNFPAHGNKCSDCKKFLDSFGKDSLHWYISYSNKVYRLDTKHIGQKGYSENEIKVTMSDYNPGTKLTLVFHKIPTDATELKSLLANAVENENYEKACVLRDLIDEKN